MVASARQGGSPASARRARTARAVSKAIPAATSTQSVRASSGEAARGPHHAVEVRGADAHLQPGDRLGQQGEDGAEEDREERGDEHDVAEQEGRLARDERVERGLVAEAARPPGEQPAGGEDDEREKAEEGPADGPAAEGGDRREDGGPGRGGPGG